MTTPTLNERAMRAIEEKVAVLNGDRGNPLDYALRRRQLQELQALIGAEIKRINVLNAQVTALLLQVDAIEDLLDNAFAPSYPSPDLGFPGIMIVP